MKCSLPALSRAKIPPDKRQIKSLHHDLGIKYLVSQKQRPPFHKDGLPPVAPGIVRVLEFDAERKKNRRVGEILLCRLIVGIGVAYAECQFFGNRIIGTQ